MIQPRELRHIHNPNAVPFKLLLAHVLHESLSLLAQSITECFYIYAHANMFSYSFVPMWSHPPRSEAVASMNAQLEVVIVISVFLARSVFEVNIVVASVQDFAAQLIAHIGCEIGALCIPVIVIAGMIGETVLNVFVKPSPIAPPYAIVWVSDLSEYIWNRQSKGKRG